MVWQKRDYDNFFRVNFLVNNPEMKMMLLIMTCKFLVKKIIPIVLYNRIIIVSLEKYSCHELCGWGFESKLLELS